MLVELARNVSGWLQRGERTGSTTAVANWEPAMRPAYRYITATCIGSCTYCCIVASVDHSE